jgi:hypothetical protein
MGSSLDFKSLHERKIKNQIYKNNNNELNINKLGRYILGISLTTIE